MFRLALLLSLIPAIAAVGMLKDKPVSGLCDTVKQYAGYFEIDPATDKVGPLLSCQLASFP